jgi:hypothetical protein
MAFVFGKLAIILLRPSNLLLAPGAWAAWRGLAPARGLGERASSPSR